jgi:phosphinothricin acetyltransferase
MISECSLTLFEPRHWNEVKEIYRLGIATGNATFETVVPAFDEWHKKFRPELLWVATLAGVIVGWAGLQPVSVRQAYRGVMEVTVYVHSDHIGKGIGTALMNHLVKESESSGIWTLYAAIFPENVASIRLHEAAGFREIGYRERIAELNGKWRNTVLYERRSQIIGI